MNTTKRNLLTVFAVLGLLVMSMSSCHKDTCPAYSKADQVEATRNV